MSNLQSPKGKKGKSNRKIDLVQQSHSSNRGISLNNIQITKIKENSNDKDRIIVKPKKRLFKGLNNLTINHDAIVKENEILKLQIAELKKENKQLKEQNLLYSSQLVNKNMNKQLILNSIDQVDLSNISKIKTNSDICIDEQLKNTEPSLNPLEITTTLQNQTIHHPILSFNNQTKKYFRLRKKDIFNQSIEVLPLFTPRTNPAFSALIKVNSGKNITGKLSHLRKRVADVLGMYSKRLYEIQSNELKC